MNNQDVCKLCDKPSQLQRSHIIPRSILKGIKAGESQLCTVSQTQPVTVSNADPKELLLCRPCEQKLSSRYEKFGTELLKKHKNVIKHADHIEFTKFKYQKWYLYYLSILWRASISTLSEFDHIDLGELNHIMKSCIKHNKLGVSSNIDIDEFIDITMFRVVDKSKIFDDSTIKNLMLIPTHVIDDVSGENLFFFLANGFLVQYRLTSYKLQVKKHTAFTKSTMARDNNRNVRIVDITESKFLSEQFNNLLASV